VKRIVLILCLLVAMAGIASAASFDKVAPMSDEQSRNFLTSLAGTPVWFDRHSSHHSEYRLNTLYNLEHVLIGNIDIDNGIIEIIKDDGSNFNWQPITEIDFGKNYEKHSAAVTLAMEVQWLFYLKNPYEEHPDWSENAWSYIKNEKVYIGMTEQMCKLSWGKPQKVNRTTGSWGTKEQWVYGDFGPYLYFDNGTLTTIQN